MFISNPNLHFIISLIDVEETRYLNGWSKDKKKVSSRINGIPVDIVDEVRIDCYEDYKKFLPDSLSAQFTTRDYAKSIYITQRLATVGLNVLLETGVIERVDKKGNSHIYSVK